MNRPSAKPKRRPAIEPPSRPTEATSSGERSAEHAEDADLRDGRRAAGSRRRGRARRGGRRRRRSRSRRGARRRAQVGAGLRSAPATKSRSAQVGGRLDVDRRSSSPSPCRRADACRSGCSAGTATGSRAETVPAVTTCRRARTALAFGHEVDQQVAGRARRPASTMPGSPRPCASAETPKSWSVSSITTACRRRRT